MSTDARLAPHLETERLILRGFSIADFDDFAEMIADPEVMRQMGGAVEDRATAWEKFLRGPAFWALFGFGLWTVEEKSSGRVAGNVGFGIFERDITPPLPAVPEAAWVLNLWAQGQGIGSEAAAAIMAWADQYLDFEFYLCVIPDQNLLSIGLAKKLGFTKMRSVSFHGENATLFKRLVS